MLPLFFQSNKESKGLHLDDDCVIIEAVMVALKRFDSEERKMIKLISNDFFDHARGLVIDNSYDPYMLRLLIKHVTENHLEYLHFQDYDLSCLKHFETVKYLSISNEAIHFSELNHLQHLKGLSLSARLLDHIDVRIKEKIEYLEVVYDDGAKVDFSVFRSLKRLKVQFLPQQEIELFNDLEAVEFHNCPKIESLAFLNNIKNLREVKLDYLPKLREINDLRKVKSIETISIFDCKKIQKVETVLGDLTNLRDIALFVTADSPKIKLNSLNFVKKLPNLEAFATNYKIENGILEPLLRLKDADITVFYKNYTLKDKDLPHTHVLINDNGIVKRVGLDALALGKEDERIIWLQ